MVDCQRCGLQQLASMGVASIESGCNYWWEGAITMTFYKVSVTHSALHIARIKQAGEQEYL